VLIREPGAGGPARQPGRPLKVTTQKWSRPCALLLRAKLVPDRAGADTQVIAHIPLSQLRQLPGARDLEDAWIRALLGRDGYLTGNDAEAAACDAQTVAVVAGTMDPAVIDQMVDLARTAAEAEAEAAAEAEAEAGAGAAHPAPRWHHRGPQPRRQAGPPQPRTTHPKRGLSRTEIRDASESPTRFG
jgi:hypothetical protein